MDIQSTDFVAELTSFLYANGFDNYEITLLPLRDEIKAIHIETVLEFALDTKEQGVSQCTFKLILGEPLSDNNQNRAFIEGKKNFDRMVRLISSTYDLHRETIAQAGLNGNYAMWAYTFRIIL